MKKIIYILLFFWFSIQAQEKQTFALMVDPYASFKEHGVDFVLEYGYEGQPMYAKIQIENFSALTGGYTSYGGVVGLNFEQTLLYPNTTVNEYAGVILVPQCFRNGGYSPQIGFEAGADINLESGFSIGGRLTHIYREDMILLGWLEIWRTSGYIKISYKIEIKQR